MKYIKILLLLIFPFSLSAQQEMTLTMDECIKMANEQSLNAFLTKNMYLAKYWDYRSYKASRLPSLHLNTTPLNYNNGFQQQWNSNDETYYTVQSQTLNSNAELSLQQKVSLTGGTISVETGNDYFNNFNGMSNFTSNPLSVSYNQNLNGFNSLKWRARIDPEKYEAAKKQYIEDREQLSITTINYFFSLINSQIDLDIANRNLANAEELFKIGKGRFEVGTITQDELLTLELDLYNTQLSKIKSEQNLVRARTDLNIFLNIDKNTIINCAIPENIPGIEIEVSEGVSQAMLNNSLQNDLNVRKMQQEQNVRRAKAENRFSSNLQLSYGLNGKDDVLGNSYTNLGQRQRVIIGFNIPIVDWGEGRGAVAVAQSNLEAERIRIEQEKISFEQEVSMNILEFNLQKNQVNNSAKADTIAQKGYDISYEIFKLGKLDVIKLNQARNSQVSARKAYINSLKQYWSYWFRIRMQTLYDFENNVTLSEDFDALINK